ncbi:HipA family kinase [Klebsiella pneumoniae]
MTDMDNKGALIPNVIEIIRRIKEGSTQPFLCKCDDGQMYVLKSKTVHAPKKPSC